MRTSWGLSLCALVMIGGLYLAGRGGEIQPVAPSTSWSIVASNLPSALMSVDGTSSEDVWFAGADKGAGPLVVHFDGTRWHQLSTGTTGDLWWVHAFDDAIFFGGAGSMLLRYDGRTFERLPVPGFARQTIYGVWGTSSRDVYAVGGSAGREGFIWHFDGKKIDAVDLPLDIPRLPNGEVPGLFKVWGRDDDVWVVGGAGTILHKHGSGGFTVVPSATREMLFTVHGGASDVIAVGGSSNGVAVRNEHATFADASPAFAGLLQGVYEGDDGAVWASGEKGLVYSLVNGRLQNEDTGLMLAVASLHSIYVDDIGGVWSVGGNVLSAALDAGAAIHRGVSVPPLVLDEPVVEMHPRAECPSSVINVAANKSVARRWDEQALASVRRDLPRPTVHARNLFHASAAMWDAWAAFDPIAKGVFVREKLAATDVPRARAEAISYAAYRVLSDHYAKAVGSAVDLACFRAVMKTLGYDPDDTTDTGSTARALGNRIGEVIIAMSSRDGANQSTDYADPDPISYNVPLVVDDVGATLADPNVWQPLNLSLAATQNGIVLPAGVQSYVGSQWGAVTPFVRNHAPYPYGSVPRADAATTSQIALLLTLASEVDEHDPATIDTSPGAYGNNTLGTNDGTGRALNPITHLPYAPQVVLRSDFGRSLAEFWADGPQSETPPGHWNVIANLVADSPSFERKLFGSGPPLDALAWDVRVYLALNGAVHDAGIAAWGEKRRAMSVRPISLIRWMGGNRTLPIIPGLIEMITDQSSAPGERHAHLALYKGQIAIRSWLGEPGDRSTRASGVGWIRAVDWMPYQRRTFVTPPFPGFISGHSTFSRAAAEVLTTLTGSPFFPGGLGEYVLPKNTWLTFEIGPTTDVHLQWATYYDASDEAGQSRIWGGIHISADDFAGRRVGSVVGKDAIANARKYFDGTAN